MKKDNAKRAEERTSECTQPGRKQSQTENSPAEVVCPVCGKRLGIHNMPTMKAVIEESLYLAEDTCIVGSKVVLEYTFGHYYDEEEGISMEDSHSLIAVIEAEFDKGGNCTTFRILKVRPAEQKNEW